jgi:hypothetical protein
LFCLFNSFILTPISAAALALSGTLTRSASKAKIDDGEIKLDYSIARVFNLLLISDICRGFYEAAHDDYDVDVDDDDDTFRCCIKKLFPSSTSCFASCKETR